MRTYERWQFRYFIHVKVVLFLPNNNFEHTHTRWWRKSKRRKNDQLTTMRFHIFAASATVVQTVLQPAKSINFCGLLYSRLYITLAPRPGSHWKQYIERIKEHIKHTLNITSTYKNKVNRLPWIVSEWKRFATFNTHINKIPTK